MAKLSSGTSNTQRIRKQKRRVLKKGTIKVNTEDETIGKKAPAKNTKKSKNIGKNTKKRKQMKDAMDSLNATTYPPVQLNSDANKYGNTEFKITREGLDKIVNLFAPMSATIEKSFIVHITDEHLIVAQEQEGVTALAYIDVDFTETPEEPITFIFSKEAIKQLRDVVADFAIFKVYDSNVDIHISDTKLEMGTEDTSDISIISIDLTDFKDYEYMNADIVNDIFGRAKMINNTSAGIFEPTVSIGSCLLCGSEYYLTEIKDCFKNFQANCNPEFLSYILNISKHAKKDVKFTTTEDDLLVMNDAGYIYKTSNLHIKFPIDVSNEFLPNNKFLSRANFDVRTLTTSLKKLTIALLGTVSPTIDIQFNPKKSRADVSVKALNNKKSIDYWSAGGMDKTKVDSFKVLVSLVINTIAILDDNITLSIYEGFITVEDETQIIIIAKTSE